MSTAHAIDLKRYGRLLAKAAPKIINSEAENRRYLGIIEGLLEKGESRLTAEEEALLDLLATLVHEFEQKHYPVRKSEPHEMLAYLLEQKGLKPKDLWPVLGSKSRVSEILAGKREISKAQARELARFFNVSADLLI